MIHAVFGIDDLSRICSFSIKGHAGYAHDEEYDLVCCAVSVLSQAIANGIEAYAPEKIHCQVKDGFLSVQLDPTDSSYSPSSQVLMKTLKDGLENIASSYPKHVGVSVERI